MEFDFYCGCTNNRCNFCSCLNTPQHYSLITIRLDYERNCLEAVYRFRVTLCHILRHMDIMNGTISLKYFLTRDSNHLNSIWYLHVQTAVALRNSAFSHGKLHTGFWRGKPERKRPLRVPCHTWKDNINLLATDFLFQMLAHAVFKMWVRQKPNKVALWNNGHFEGEKMEIIIQHV